MVQLPPPGPARRRLVALGVAAFVALVVGFVVGSGSGGSEPARTVPKPSKQAVARAKGMSLERQVGELLVIAFPPPGVPSDVKRALRQGRASGVVLFRGNAKTQPAMRAVTSAVQRAGRGRVLICLDQEGGPIRILPWDPPVPAQSAQGTPGVAQTQAKEAAKALAADGVNVTLAPVADVGTPGSVMRARAFPGGVTQVASMTAAAVRGYTGTRVAATLKHFPGFGSAGQNTDDVRVTISSPKASLETRDLPPFKAGVKAGAPIVMASHAVYSGIDRKNIASQSPVILNGLLRKELGFKGVVMTDSMEAAAVLKRSSLEEAALRSVNAGADLLLLTGARSFPRVYKQLLEGAKRSPKFRARIAEAAARVIALKRSLGMRRG